MTELNPIIHAPLRLRLCAILSAVEAAEFHTLRDSLQVADSVLSKHASALAEAGYLTTRKETIDGRRTTWIGLTRAGRRAVQEHMRALEELIGTAAPPARPGAR
ncbi:MAG TPA: transcriptional regulator [Acidimicrobiales bacterium]|nr:transcriptional regulator [Acidimicrobiales bacterium]